MSQRISSLDNIPHFLGTSNKELIQYTVYSSHIFVFCSVAIIYYFCIWTLDLCPRDKRESTLIIPVKYILSRNENNQREHVLAFKQL